LLNCLDAVTGKPVWQRAVLADNKLENIEWGVSASPLIVDDKVIVTGGKTQGPVLFAYQSTTGGPLWKAGNDQASYASPILATVAGRRIIMSNNARALTGYDPASGTVLFDHAWGGEKWPKASQPVVISTDRVFISAGYGMGCRMLQIQAEPGGRLSATEVWSNMKLKTQFNSPALYEGHLYGLDDGRLACLDVASGERLWKEGRFASGQSLLAGDVVIVQNESGPVHLCVAKPEGFQEIGRINALSSKTWNHPVLAGHYLLVRNDREAVCYELP
jgi:outer membrane protein assembly factor BamB